MSGRKALKTSPDDRGRLNPEHEKNKRGNTKIKDVARPLLHDYVALPDSNKWMTLSPRY